MIRKFFYETFRPRNKSEYREVFSRGFNCDDEPNNKYPWLYARVFAALFFVFAVYAVICFVIGNSFYRQTLYFIGGLFLDISLLILAFELYPHKDFSLILLFAVTVIGGTVADVISAGIYSIFTTENGWIIAVIAGVGEEIAKAVATVLAIILLKKKGQPPAGFLIGAAVGTWFSLTENPVYIASEYQNWVKILTALGRAVSAPFSHAMWAAIIGWAFCYFKKPLLNFKFYAVLLLCMALHFLCDMPLLDNFPLVLILIFACAAEAAVTFFIGVKIIVKERKKVLGGLMGCEENADCEENGEGNADGENAVKFTPKRKADMFLLGAGALFCALALALSSVFSFKYIDEYQTKFTSVDEYLLYMQGGLEFSPDDRRTYDENAENLNEVTENGVLVYCEQLVSDGKYDYYYCYQRFDNYSFGEISEEFTLSDIYVQLERDGEQRKYSMNTQFVFCDDTNTVAKLNYFQINEEAADVKISYTDGNFKFEEVAATKKVYSTATIILICLTCAEAVAGIVVWLILRRKASKSTESDI